MIAKKRTSEHDKAVPAVLREEPDRVRGSIALATFGWLAAPSSSSRSRADGTAGPRRAQG